MITSFFNKILPKKPEGGGLQSKSEQCAEHENAFPGDATKSYREEIDQFIKKINGNESSRSYAANILEKTKGNIIMALDLHYEGNLGENSERLRNSVESQFCTQNCTSTLEKSVSEELGHTSDLSVQRPLKEHMDSTLVSLPPEKYDPIEHACWRSGQPAPYIHFARTFDFDEAEKGKIRAMLMLCNMFRSLLALSPEDLLPAMYLCTNKIAADHENIVAEKMSLIEQYKMERERQQKMEEEEEIRRLRKELVPKAQPMPYFDRPFIPRRSHT